MFTTFSARDNGRWRVSSQHAVRGAPLGEATSISITQRPFFFSRAIGERTDQWHLIGRASHVRYVEKRESEQLTATQAALGRAEATCAALIPIRKSDAWWKLTQDERRDIFESKSRHIADSLKYLPMIARQLYHSRDLGQQFDFLTWFEFAPEHTSLFDDLVAHLRGTPEWAYVEHEVDIRMTMASL